MTLATSPHPPAAAPRAWAMAAVLCALPGCLGAPVRVQPVADVHAPERFTQSGEAALPDSWWTTFDDAHLTAHVQQALAANRDLEGIWHAFREACAVARRTGAARLPVVDLFADAGLSRGSGNRDDEELSAGGAVEFEVDLWGRLEAIYRIGSQSPLEIADAVNEVLEQARPGLPPCVAFRIDNDSASEFRDRLSLLIDNAIQAVVIVFVILALFLEFKLAFWVMLGMVVSFIGSIIFMPTVGLSVNMISLFGFIVALAPIILETSLQAQYLIPMAISLGFGIVFATAIILVLVPCLYVVIEDLKRLLFAPKAGKAAA